MLTDEQIRALRDGCENVTPGPWQVYGNGHVGDESGHLFGCEFSEDAAHIARCDPQTISELCTRVLEAEANLRVCETRESEKIEALQARVKVLEDALCEIAGETELTEFGGPSGRWASRRARKALEEGK